MVGKKTKLYSEVKRCGRDALTGTLIAFDPSTGSKSSMPGYAIFKKGKLVESGIIQVNSAARRNVRLYSITQALLNEFPEPDVIAVENIPPVQYNRGRAMGGWALVAIQRSIGAIISCFDSEYIEVAPKAWQSYKFDGYNKSDEHDAICIGICVIETAKQIYGELAEDG